MTFLKGFVEDVQPIFPFPPMDQGIAPIWKQGQFYLGEKTTRVLDYLAENDNFGWTDGLTAFHESEAGDNHFIDQASRKNALQELHKNLKTTNPVILEIGCSSGFMLQEIQKKFPTAYVIGADILKESLFNLGERISNVPLLRFDLTKCPLPDSSVDAIVLLNVLEHIEADDKAMAQVKRILKPGGIAVIEVPAGPNLYDIYDKMLLHFRRYTLSMLRALINKQGLMVKRASHLACFLYPGFWLVKKRNRKQFSGASSVEVAKQKVSESIQKTQSNFLLNALMQFELFLGKKISYPLGIRCIVTCVKPELTKGT